MKHLWKVLLVAGILFPLQGFCSLDIEPYLGYASLKDSGSAKLSGTPVSIDDTTAKGPLFGARIGYGFGPLSIGADYTTGTLDNDGDDQKVTDMGVYARFALPIVHFWAEYILSAKNEIDSSTFSRTITNKGSGEKVGAGFTFFPFLSLNLEYIMKHYDDCDYSSLTSLDEDNKGIMISISAPLSL